MWEESDNLEFVQGVRYEIIDSLKNNGTKYLFIFDDSCEEICNSKEFVDIATAGRHRGLSTIYIKQNLFHQSILGRDVDLENTHIVLFKSLRDVILVSRLSAQLGLGSELVDWYRDATSVPYGHLLIDLSPRTDNRRRYCTNTESFLQNIISHNVWSIQSLWKMNKIFLLSKCSNRFPTSAKVTFFSVVQKEFIRLLFECIKNLLKRNLQSIKRHHVAKLQNEIRLLFLKRTTWKQRRDVLASEKELRMIEIIIPPVTNQLSWHGATCRRSCFWIQQEFDYPNSYQKGTSKVPTFTKSHVANWFT